MKTLFTCGSARASFVWLTRVACAALCAAALTGGGFPAASQNSPPSSSRSQHPQDPQVAKDAEAETELERALADAGDDSAATVRNLTNYLRKYPDAPRKAAIYRALVEACQQVQNFACAIDYAERFIALRPDDSDMMLLAANLLEQKGDDASLVHAVGYVTRVLDRAEKAQPEERSPRESLAEWRAGQDQLRSMLYFARGRMEESRHNTGDAAEDLSRSYAAVPNAVAARGLGEIAELSQNPDMAIEQYLLAFVLPEESAAGRVDRRDVREKLGNVWRQQHGSESGLGDAILAAYDRVSAPAAPAQASPAAVNKNAKDTFSFVLRRMDGTAVPLAPLKGKVLVLSFWATWCGPCRELEPEFNNLAAAYTKNPDVAFLAVNVDDDQAKVAPFLALQKWDLPAVYADGLDDFLKIETLPTVLVLDHSGEISYRVNSLPPGGVNDSLIAAIQKALGNSTP